MEENNPERLMPPIHEVTIHLKKSTYDSLSLSAKNVGATLEEYIIKELSDLSITRSYNAKLFKPATKNSRLSDELL